MSNNSILIVDDEPTVRQLLQAVLLNSGYEVMLAENGRMAFEILKSERPDLILLDIMMPEISGYDVIDEIKKNEELKNIPIMLVTALDDRDNRIKGLELGAVDYISKPFDRVEILTKINNIITNNDLKKQEKDNTSELSKLNHLINEINQLNQIHFKSDLNFDAFYLEEQFTNRIGIWQIKYDQGTFQLIVGSQNPVKEDNFQLAIISIWLHKKINKLNNRSEIDEFLNNQLNFDQIYSEKKWWYVALFSEDENNKCQIKGINTGIICVQTKINTNSIQKDTFNTFLINNTPFDISHYDKILIHCGSNYHVLTKPESKEEIAALILRDKTNELKQMLKDLEGNPNHVNSYLVYRG